MANHMDLTNRAHFMTIIALPKCIDLPSSFLLPLDGEDEDLYMVSNLIGDILSPPLFIDPSKSFNWS
jgi:hypothetical protein